VHIAHWLVCRVHIALCILPIASLPSAYCPSS
jgi:hypothetical protein